MCKYMYIVQLYMLVIITVHPISLYNYIIHSCNLNYSKRIVLGC